MLTLSRVDLTWLIGDWKQSQVKILLGNIYSAASQWFCNGSVYTEPSIIHTNGSVIVLYGSVIVL